MESPVLWSLHRVKSPCHLFGREARLSTAMTVPVTQTNHQSGEGLNQPVHHGTVALPLQVMTMVTIMNHRVRGSLQPEQVQNVVERMARWTHQYNHCPHPQIADPRVSTMYGAKNKLIQVCGLKKA